MDGVFKEKENESMMKKIIEYSKVLFDNLRGRIIKFALLKIFGRVIGGFWGFLATEIIGRVVDKFLKPVYNWAIRKVYVYVNKINIKKKAVKVEEAKNENDFDRSVDDLP